MITVEDILQALEKLKVIQTYVLFCNPEDKSVAQECVRASGRRDVEVRPAPHCERGQMYLYRQDDGFKLYAGAFYDGNKRNG